MLSGVSVLCRVGISGLYRLAVSVLYRVVKYTDTCHNPDYVVHCVEYTDTCLS